MKKKTKQMAEPSPEYGQGLTFEKVWAALQETKEILRISQLETDKR